MVESCQEGPTFLDDYCDHVCYTKSNDPSALPSFNEAVSMKIGIEQFNFDPDELIIKVTGRYVLKKPELINFVIKNSRADLIARKWIYEFPDGSKQHDAYTGCFAIKVKYLEEVLDNYFQKAPTPDTPYQVGSQSVLYCIEWALGDYINQKKELLKIEYIPRLYDYLPETLGRK